MTASSPLPRAVTGRAPLGSTGLDCLVLDDERALVLWSDRLSEESQALAVAVFVCTPVVTFSSDLGVESGRDSSDVVDALVAIASDAPDSVRGLLARAWLRAFILRGFEAFRQVMQGAADDGADELGGGGAS